MSSTESMASNVFTKFQFTAANPQPVREIKRSRDIGSNTGVPIRYRAEWDRTDTNDEWAANHAKILSKMNSGGIIAVIGNRGTGKTRISAEVMRDYSPVRGDYITAMGLFLRIRASFNSKGETEDQIVNEVSRAKMLIIDEVQERGNTPWEDRILTHILDRRYADMRPTIIIANLTESALTECLGESIVSRLFETGGILEMNGKSHRTGK